MSAKYIAVGWNRQKRIYDLSAFAGVLAYISVYVGVSAVLHPTAVAETLIIRSTGTAAFLLLHVILSIGPLCRLDRRFLPWLYNRRHLGVMMFVLALTHGVLSILHFHGFGDLNPLLSLFVSETEYTSLTNFPFQPLGFFALIILFLMAATSHDFWLKNLTPPVWKTLHMLVYVAYALIVMHVGLGILQETRNPAFAVVTGAGLVWVLGLHLVAAFRSDEPLPPKHAPTNNYIEDGYVYVCQTGDIAPDRAKIVTVAGERIAVFRYAGEDDVSLLSAISNVCRHQNGPLGEGRIVDGCVVCPWHGFQYDPATGSSPPPYTEKVPTFPVYVDDDQRVYVDPQPRPPGSFVEPARLEVTQSEHQA